MDTPFLLTLPDGSQVRCWTRESDLIERDVRETGTVILVRDPASEVYERVAPDSVEAPALRKHGRQVS